MHQAPSNPSYTIEEWNKYCESFRDQALALDLDENYIERCLDYAYRLYSHKLPIIYDDLHLSKLMGIKADYLLTCSNSTSKFYRTFEIAKRSGKPRQISEPLPTLKFVQRWIRDRILLRILPSRYAKAYSPRCSVRENARFHLKQPVVVIMDVKDFFPSIRVSDVYRIFRECGYTSEVAGLLSGLTTLHGAIPQGAPTSPAISNIFCRSIDKRIAGYCIPRGIRFTRYADDFAFSGDFVPGALIKFATKVLAEEKLQVKPDKTRVLRQHQRQLVTGVVVNQYRQAPREYRRKLRQEAYYISKYGIGDHMRHSGLEKINYREHLRGKVSHVLMLNPKDEAAKATLAMLKEQSPV